MLEWPLVGRERELRRIAAAMEGDAAAGIAVVGDAGVGKTRLVAEVGRRLSAHGRVVEWVRASPSAQAIPYGALAHAVTIRTDGSDGPGLLARLAEQLRARATDDGPLVLIVDDAQHLDHSSAALIHLAIASQAASVAITARSAAGEAPTIMQLWKDGLVERIELGPLGEQATRSLAEAVLEGPVDDLTGAMLARRSAGNPLFLRELLLSGIEAGAITRGDGIWRATTPIVPSTRLAELVLERLGRLNGAEQAMLDLLAVGGPVDMRLAERISRQGALELLEERRLVIVEQLGNRHVARLAHPVYEEVIQSAMPRTRMRRVMRQLADGLESVGARRREDVLRLALWRLDGGGAADASLFIKAATEALATFDAELAERLARAAMHETGGVAAPLLLGRALSGQQRIADAEAAFAQAAAAASADDEIAEIALARANLLYFRSGRMADATKTLVDALASVTDPDWRDELEALLVLFKAGAGQLRPVAEAGRRIARRPGARPRTVVHTLVYSSIANVMLGRFAEAVEQVDIGLAHVPAVRSELPLSGEMLAINRVMANAYAGRLGRALALGGDGHRAALEGGAPEVVAMWSMNVGECQLLAGDIEKALELVLASLAVTRSADPFGVRGIGASVASICASWLGQHNLARSLLDEIVDHGLAIDVRSRIWSDRASAWLRLEEVGAAATAAQLVDQAERAAADTHLVWAAWQLHDAVRIGPPELARPRLAALAERVGGEMVPTMALHALALASADGLQLERVASAFERMGSRLFAAEAAAQAQQAYLHAGRDRLARVAGARASLLAAACPGVQTPALRHAAPVPLTARELEIARLAADGLSSREVADRLRISVRTVDNHLGTIYSKLGVRGRAELSGVIGLA